MAVTFGSEGFRGIVGHTLTRESVARVVSGAASYLRERFPDRLGQPLPVGYDTRFLARPLAGYIARLLTAEKLKPLLAHRPCPSPYLSFAVRHLRAPLGIQVTASHNPPLYGGIKLKGAHGGSLFPADAELIEQLANAADVTKLASQPFVRESQQFDTFGLETEYREAVLQAAAWEGIAGLNLLVDFMHGSAAELYRDILGTDCELHTVLHAEPDPLFGGSRPEPSPDLLTELAHLVAHDGRDALGLAFDGDGDRLAVVNEAGRFLAAHEVFCLLLEHLVTNHGRGGVVVTTVSLSGLARRVAEAHGCTVSEVPVGYKYVSQAMVQHQAIMGGEESGGTGFGHHLPDRDALLMALMLLRARELAGVQLGEMVEQLYATYGRPAFVHRDVALSTGCDSGELSSRLRGLVNLPRLAGEEVVGLNHSDGMKLRTETGWVLVRLSGTEPLLRVYAEGDSEGQAEAMIEDVLSFLTPPG